MSGEISIDRIETASAFGFLQMGLALKADGHLVPQGHMNALIAHLNAREALSSRVYFSLHQGKVLYLSMLEGLALYAALFAFAESLRSFPHDDAARAVLKSWLDGDDRSVAYTMVVLKWGADSKTVPAAMDWEPPFSCAEEDLSQEAQALPDLMALTPMAESLRDDRPEIHRPSLKVIKKIAELDGKRLGAVWPPLVDALAGENRDQMLDILSSAIKTGLDVSPVMPVLAGLLVDRDYYDSITINQLYECLTAAVEADADISLAWPFLPLSMPNLDPALRLLKAGARRGLSLSPMRHVLFRCLDMPLLPENGITPLEKSAELERAHLALEILATGVDRGDFTAEDIDGECR